MLLAFPLVDGHIYGWPAWSFGMIALSFAAFFFHERRREKAGKSELLPVSLLTNPRFLLGITVLVFFSGVAGFFLVLAVFLQTGFGFTPLESGLTTVPFPCGVLLASFVSGRLSDHSPRARLAGGATALLIGMFLLRMRVSEVARLSTIGASSRLSRSRASVSASALRPCSSRCWPWCRRAMPARAREPCNLSSRSAAHSASR